MEFLYSDDPIIACSSNNTSNAAIAIIRLSGFKNLEFLSDCISLSIDKVKNRFAHYCELSNEDKKIDDIILTYFKGPHTFNGENILELGVHGNLLLIEKIITFFEKKGFRRAYPGEFSYRALKNKKLSLSQIEGLDLILNANSNFALEQGDSLLSGSLKESFSTLYKNFLNHKSAVELSIDFIDDVGEEQSQIELKKTFTALKENISKLKSQCNNSGYSILKPNICLFGEPNSGKSSFFNSLLDNDRAIVSDIAGTTRDYLTESFKVNNVMYELVDTAGIRETNDSIEAEGVNRSFKVFTNAFFKILLVNSTLEVNKDFLSELKNIDILLFTHKDLDSRDFKTKLKEILGPIGADEKFAPIEPEKYFGPIGTDKKSGSIEPKKYFGPIGADKKSGSIEPVNIFGPIGASEESGSMGPIILEINSKLPSVGEIELIKYFIDKKFLKISSSNPITLERHTALIRDIYSKLNAYEDILFNMNDISIISSELNIVGHCISELIGIVSPDEVLSNIFENFCIGK